MASQQRPTRPLLTPQNVMGTVFTIMGLITLALPVPVLRLSLPASSIKAYGITPPLVLMTCCFGSQAALCGLLLLTSTMTRRTYLAFGLAMVPYFVFDVWAWVAGAVTGLGALGDGAGNVVFSVCSYLGWRREMENRRVHFASHFE